MCKHTSGLLKDYFTGLHLNGVILLMYNRMSKNVIGSLYNMVMSGNG